MPTPSGPGELLVRRPARPVAVVALGHGAGGGFDAPDLIAVTDALVAVRVIVAQFVQPYRVAGRRAPAPAGRLDEAWLAAVTQLRGQRGVGQLPLIVAGRSSGARVACRTATDAAAAGAIALAFPVHPPGRPDKSRLDELELPSVPVLVVQGDRDAFGMPPPGPSRRLVVIPGADHSLKRDTAAVARAVVDFAVQISSR